MESTLKILILEDMEEDVVLIKRTLKNAGLLFETRQAHSREGFVQALNEYSADVILSDHSLPQFNSVEALEICKKRGSQVPFILVTGAVSEEFAVTCLKQGADDYVLKSNLARLPSAIKNAIRKRELALQQKNAELELRSRNEELVKINKGMERFIYSVSHNI